MSLVLVVWDVLRYFPIYVVMLPQCLYLHKRCCRNLLFSCSVVEFVVLVMFRGVGGFQVITAFWVTSSRPVFDILRPSSSMNRHMEHFLEIAKAIDLRNMFL